MAHRGPTSHEHGAEPGDGGSTRRPAATDPDPGERPLGADEPSAPVDVPPDRPRPDLGPDVPPGDPQGPDLRA